jgi:diguanylate cyclase (GGDEF)-like protein/PAS domain S-box-containing protein
MKQTHAFSAVAVLAFLSFSLFVWGLSQQGAAPHPVVSAGQNKPVTHAHHGKTKAAPKSLSPKAVTPPAGTEGRPTSPALLAGGIGLLLTTLAGLGLSRRPQGPQTQTSRRPNEADEAARKKQQQEFEDGHAALQLQLLEAKQRKAETEALREQVSRQFQEFFRTLPVPCFCFAANGRIIRWNAACETLYGIPAASALESTLWETIVPVSEREEAEAKISQVLGGESLLTMERWDTVAGGGLARLRCSMVPLYDADGMIIGGLSAGVEAAELTRQEQQIAALTAELEVFQAAEQVQVESEASLQSPVFALSAESGCAELSGHPAFRIRLIEEIERAARYHAPLSLVLLDLDNFTSRNRTFGFPAGDLALQSTVAVIKSKIRTVDVLARFGADEYAIILPETGEAGARVAAERMRTGIAGISSNGLPPLTACFGVVQLTPAVSGADALITCALDALKNARSCGANTVVHHQDLPENGFVALPATKQGA